MQREKGKEPLREAVKRLDERLWHQLEEVWRLAEEGIRDAQILIRLDRKLYCPFEWPEASWSPEV
ncbi:MAG: hypothetical protein OEW09_07485 [Anaerolineae bacterium]|nr:hypothetical protein [Anaerolineae bacterium]